MSEDTVRVTIEVPASLSARAARLPWGVRGKLFRRILEMIVDAHEEDGDLIIGAILSGDLAFHFVQQSKKVKR